MRKLQKDFYSKEEKNDETREKEGKSRKKKLRPANNISNLSWDFSLSYLASPFYLFFLLPSSFLFALC